MDATVLIIFVIVYLGMLLGEIPGLVLDRTGSALLGAIAFFATGHISPHDARGMPLKFRLWDYGIAAWAHGHI